jgi:hypothetical protein
LQSLPNPFRESDVASEKSRYKKKRGSGIVRVYLWWGMFVDITSIDVALEGLISTYNPCIFGAFTITTYKNAFDHV